MKTVKTIVGSLGVLFALAHVVGLIGALTQKATSLGSAYSTGGFFGRIAGIAIGIAIASACFRRQKENGSSFEVGQKGSGRGV